MQFRHESVSRRVLKWVGQKRGQNGSDPATSSFAGRLPCRLCSGHPIEYDAQYEASGYRARSLGVKRERARGLVLSLMRTLTAPGADVTDEEVFRRDAQLEAGRVAPVLHEEFVPTHLVHSGGRLTGPTERANEDERFIGWFRIRVPWTRSSSWLTVVVMPHKRRFAVAAFVQEKIQSWGATK